jgi:hypothetical protein
MWKSLTKYFGRLNILWRVCARGHYAVHPKPLRAKPAGDENDFEVAMQRGLPSQGEGGYRFDLVREEGNDFSPYLHFPGSFALSYPVNGYARTAEFRRIVEGLDVMRPLAQWKSHYFYAHVGITEIKISLRNSVPVTTGLVSSSPSTGSPFGICFAADGRPGSGSFVECTDP